MPKFKPNTSSAMKMKSVYKMKYQGDHSAFPFKSPLEYEKDPVGPVVKDKKEKFVESLGGLKDPNIKKEPTKNRKLDEPRVESKVSDKLPKLPVVEHEQDAKDKSGSKPKKRGWFNLPDLGITEAFDAMTKKQKEGGTGFYRSAPSLLTNFYRKKQ